MQPRFLEAVLTMKREDYAKPDFWSRKAREEGYPARSVYKLREIAGKFNLFANIGGGGVFHIHDLGAAPGSWSH
jgi:23S rRNA (uridine2552-2'-O)-methyltransferase